VTQRKFRALSAAGICVVMLGIVSLVSGARAQNASTPAVTSLPSGYVIPPADKPCILPGYKLDLQCIVANDPDAKRIRAEEAALESQALAAAQSGTLDPYHQVQTLGQLEIFDPNLAVNNNVACSYCHDPAAGYGNGISILSVFTGGTNPGSVPITVQGAYPNNRIGKRNPPKYSYASYFPPLQYRQAQADFYGGNFWDGRATGFMLQNSAAEQAQDPPGDPEEMANPDPACVVWKVSTGNYKFFFEQVFGSDALNITWPSNVAQVCSTPKGAASLGGNPTPLSLSVQDRTRASQAYGEFGQAIAAYEASPAVSPFTSQFDYYLTGKATLTPNQLAGYELFRGKANCNSCHLDGRSSAATGGTDGGAATSAAPLFTDFTYNNLGLPRNVNLPFYSENTPDQLGFTGNPLGIGFTDSGMGLFLTGFYGALPNVSWGDLAPQFTGKFQTATARDAAMMPYPGFVKAFMHNGYLTSLKQVVHFYNTRDLYAFPVRSGQCPSGTVEKVTCWPMPEDRNNINKTIGNLGLTGMEEDEIVAFLQTLVDGFKP
jgi:cytochrome c peroxidase